MARFVVYGMLRDRLSLSAKIDLRRAADRLLMPVGSVGGVRTWDKTVALTFDDGPHPQMTTRVLDVLAQRQVLATFFVLVESAEAYPEIVRRMVAEGHEVGLHGIEHTALTTLPIVEVRRQLRQGRCRLEAITGTAVRWFRPAYGAQTLRIYLEIRRAGMDVVVWSVNPKDYAATDAAEVVARTAQIVIPGDIVLLHDAKGDGAAEDPSRPRIDCAVMVERLLEELESLAYEVTTVGRLLETGATRRLAWFRPDKSPAPDAASAGRVDASAQRPSTRLWPRGTRSDMFTGAEDHRDDLRTPSPVPVKDVTLTVVTYNSAGLLPRFLTALPAALEGVGSCEVVVIDNASTDDTLEVARAYAPGATVVALDRNSGYAGGVNAGLAASPPSEAVYVLNPDTILQPGSVRVLLDALAAPGVGIAAPKILAPDGTLDTTLRREPTLARAFGTALLGARAGRWATLGEDVLDPECYCRPTTADWAVGAALMVSRACVEAVGPWDETFFLYSEETDFCLRARDLGFELRLAPDAVVVHIGGRYPSGRLYSMLVWNKYRLYRRRHGAARSTAFRCALILGEALRAVAGSPLSRVALAALLIPARRPPEVSRA